MVSVKDVNVSAPNFTQMFNLEIIPSSQKDDDVKWISLGEGK
jgi:hypothetical protein